MKKLEILKFLILLNLFFYSCSIKKIAVKETASLIDNGMPAIFREENLEYAKQAIPANLKLMEILLENKKDDSLLLNASIGFCGYAFAFLEDENIENATSFYLKGLKYSEILLENKKLVKNGHIIKEKIDKKNVPYLFWNTFCKSGLVNINRDKPEYLTLLSEIEEQGEIILKIYPEYFYNSIYALLGSYYSSKPKILGGNPQKALEYFEKAISDSGKDFLMNYFMYAKTYAVMSQDEELFDKNLNFILNYQLKQNDEKTFFNKIAIEKAKKLKEKKDDLF